jgi:hypothetical protein
MYAQGVTTFCLMLSFSIWAGQFNSNFLNVETLKCFYMADQDTGVLFGSPTYVFSGGFAIVIIAWMFSPLSAAILFWKQDEVEIVDPAAAAAGAAAGGAGAGGAAAVQDAFPSGAVPPPLPPGVPSYGGGAPYAPPYSGGGGNPYGGGGGGVPYENVRIAE